MTTLPNRYTNENKQKMKLDLYKQNQQHKLGLAAENKTKFETVDDRIVFYRHLGHFEIQDGNIWKVDTGCWICNKWKYSVVICNPSTIEGSFRPADQINTEYFHQKISDANSADELEETNRFTGLKIVGTFSKWKCREMMKIDKFYDRLLRNSLPQQRMYMRQGGTLLKVFSRVLNKEIYMMMRNKRCFASRRKPTIMQRLLNKYRHTKIKKKTNLDMVQIPSYAIKE
jgi:hypothetical protein